jgi:hypothetical protein
VNLVESLGVDFELITSLTGEDLNKEKIKYMDFKKINRLNILDLKFLDGLDKSKIYFKSNKIVVKSGKTFCSRWHAKVMINSENVRNSKSEIPALIDESFKEEADYFYFLTKEQL